MAGLNFQTQTIINSNLDPDSSALNGAGAENTWLYKAVKEKIDGVETDVLKIKRDFVFAKEGIKAVRMRKGYDAVACEAVINFADITEIQPTTEQPKKYCRLDIYLGVEGAEPFIYATPWVQKGMPFWVEFTVTNDNKGRIAEVVASMIKKNHLFLVDKDLLTVEASGNELILTGNTEYQRFRNVEVRTFSATDDYAELAAELGGTAIELVERGKNSFGTYSQIVKDLRLPTAANYQWTHIRQVETPIVGAIYDQFIVEYCAPASNDGLAAVGQRLESHTTHVFWVNQAESDNFKAELEKVATVEDVDAKSEEEVEANELDA